MKNVASTVGDKIPSEKKEAFHEFLRSFTNRFANNCYQTKDETFKKLHPLKNKGNIVLLSSDKDSCVVILDKIDSIRKVDDLISEGIRQGVYTYNGYKTHEDLENFCAFLLRNFDKSEFYKDIWICKNQPGRLFCTVKTQKFRNYGEITIENLKLRPITDHRV